MISVRQILENARRGGTRCIGDSVKFIIWAQESEIGELERLVYGA